MDVRSEKRILWIDVARGMAILLVILGHCIGNLSDPGNRFILAFHMPIFFFLSFFLECVLVRTQFQ